MLRRSAQIPKLAENEHLAREKHPVERRKRADVAWRQEAPTAEPRKVSYLENGIVSYALLQHVAPQDAFSGPNTRSLRVLGAERTVAT